MIECSLEKLITMREEEKNNPDTFIISKEEKAMLLFEKLNDEKIREVMKERDILLRKSDKSQDGSIITVTYRDSEGKLKNERIDLTKSNHGDIYKVMKSACANQANLKNNYALLPLKHNRWKYPYKPNDYWRSFANVLRIYRIVLKEYGIENPYIESVNSDRAKNIQAITTDQATTANLAVPIPHAEIHDSSLLPDFEIEEYIHVKIPQAFTGFLFLLDSKQEAVKTLYSDNGQHYCRLKIDVNITLAGIKQKEDKKIGSYMSMSRVLANHFTHSKEIFMQPDLIYSEQLIYKNSENSSSNFFSKNAVITQSLANESQTFNKLKK